MIAMAFVPKNTTIDKISYTIDNRCPYSAYNLDKRGFFVHPFKADLKSITYVISAGKKSKDGYSIFIKNVSIDQDNRVKVVVQEKYLARENFKYPDLHPTVCIDFNLVPLSITIVSDKGEIFEILN